MFTADDLLDAAMAQADDLADVAVAEAPGVGFADRSVSGISGRLVAGNGGGESSSGISHVKKCTETLTRRVGPYRFLYMEANEKALQSLTREYPESQWSQSIHDDDSNEIMVTFQRYSDDAEDRYVIRNGQAVLI